MKAPLPLLVFACALAGAAAVPSAAQLTLADSALAVQVDALVKGVPLRVRNTGTAPVTLDSAKIDSVTSASGAAIPALSVTVPRAPIAPNAVGTLTVRGDSISAARARGRYGALLELTPSGGTATRLKLVLVAAGTPVAAGPLVTTLKTRAVGGWPFGRFDGVVEVPATDSGPVPAARYYALGTTAGAPALAAVESVRRWTENGHVHAYQVRVEGLRGGRTYTGAIPLGAGSTMLTVDASDPVIYPLLVIVLGVLAGLLFRRWGEIGEPLSLLRERNLRLGERFDAAFSLYQKPGGSAALLEAEVRKARDGITAEIKALQWKLRKDETKLGQIEKEVSDLEADAALVERLAADRLRLDALATALKPTLAPFHTPGDPVGEARGIVAARGTLLSDAPLRADLDAADAAVRSQSAFLARLGVAYHNWAGLNAWMRQLDPTGNDPVLQDARTRLTTVRDAIWLSPDAQAFDAVSPPSLLAGLEQTLYDISVARQGQHLRAAGLNRTAATSPAMAAARAGWMLRAGAVPDLDLPPAMQTERAEYVRRSRALNDLAAGAGSFVAAVVTLLLTNYFDHPFGTASNYSTVFSTGFAMTAGLDLLASGLAALKPVLTRVTTRIVPA